MKERASKKKLVTLQTHKKKYKEKNMFKNNSDKDFKSSEMGTEEFAYSPPGKWYEEVDNYESEPTEIKYEELQKLRTEAGSVFTETVMLNNAKTPKSLSKSDYAWVRTVLSKGTKTDKIAAYTLLIQDAPLYNLSLIKNMVEMVKVGKNKECFMAIDTLCELFLNDLLPPNRKLMSFADQPLSKLDKISSGNAASRKNKLFLWFFEDQLKSVYGDFITSLNKIAHDSVDANKEKVITVMCKLLEGHPEKENLLLNNIVNKLGDPSHKVGSKVIYALTKLLEIHPNMREVVIDAVEKVIFRSNISKRAQYYSVCFLSQFCLFAEDAKVAKKLILIYLSLFKACIKTGDVDSRMMSALLTGVKRAYPFAKEELGMLKDHINTIYKVIHLSHANIAIQALSLVYLISDYSNAYVDRFYSALYRKIGEAGMFKSAHHAMFLSLIFKALKKDKENSRISTFIKRLLQICMYIPIPVACGILIMISEVIKTKKNVLLKESLYDPNAVLKLEEDSDDDVEHYEDVKEEDENGKKVPTTDFKKNEEEENKKPTKIKLENIYNIQPSEELKVWTNPDKSAACVEDAQILNYNPFVRNPLYCGGDKTLYYELFELSKHFHPTISLFANKIINGELIVYSGDPLLDFTLIRFLDKFSFKNPKEIKSDEEKKLTFSKFGRKKYYSSATVRRLRANTADYLNHSEKNIPADELFLYRYMKEKWQKDPGGIEKDENSDLESVGSEEFEDMLSGLAEGSPDDINFMREVGQLPKKTKKKGEEENESEVEFEGEDKDDSDDEGSEGGSIAEDFEGDEMDDFGEDDDFEMQGSDVDEDELEAELVASGIKIPKLTKIKGHKKAFRKMGKEKHGDNLFAAAEEFSELLEETDYNAGGSEALSNKDRAGAKQLKWESDRDKWIHKKNYKSKNIKRPHRKAKQGKLPQRGKKKRF